MGRRQRDRDRAADTRKQPGDPRVRRRGEPKPKTAAVGVERPARGAARAERSTVYPAGGGRRILRAHVVGRNAEVRKTLRSAAQVRRRSLPRPWRHGVCVSCDRRGLLSEGRCCIGCAEQLVAALVSFVGRWVRPTITEAKAA